MAPAAARARGSIGRAVLIMVVILCQEWEKAYLNENRSRATRGQETVPWCTSARSPGFRSSLHAAQRGRLGAQSRGLQGRQALRLYAGAVGPIRAGGCRAGGFSEPLLPGHDLRPLRIALVGGRHDLHTVLVEYVQDVPVERAVQQEYQARIVAVGVDLIVNRKGPQCLLQHEWARLLQEARRAARGFEQHRLHLAPGSLIVDADDGVQYQAGVLSQAAEVHDLAVEDERVGDHDLLVLGRT